MTANISIVIPSYNRADVISETLDSLLLQSYMDWECIIVDDGSTDNTKIVVSRYLQDKRFSFYDRPQTMLKGANSCRNFGFEKSKGKYIKFLDSDDLLTDDCLQKQVSVMEKNPNIKLCLSYGQYFNDKTKVREEYWSRNMDYANYLVGHITNKIRWAISDILWRRSFFKKSPFREGLMNSQEWLMHGQALLNLQNIEIYNLKETFTLIRRGNVRMSSVKSSNYYKNQKLARFYLLIDVLTKRFNFVAIAQLLKQILVFQFWQFKMKVNV